MPKINPTVSRGTVNVSDAPARARTSASAATPHGAPDARLTDFYASARRRGKAIAEGNRVRAQVRVQSVAPGIVQTTIRPAKPHDASLAADRAPLARIQSLLREKSQYTRLTVIGGASATKVLGTAEGALPERPEALARNTPAPSAIINGGYFIHRPGLLDDNGREITRIGVPIGPTSHRQDHQPISRTWKKHYGQVRIGTETGLCSGPLLARNGTQEAVPFGNNEFTYRPDGKNENELNRYGGAMTPSGDPIERSAISVNPSTSAARGDVVMHALTAGGSRTNGATMAVWQQLTRIGADSAQGHARSSGTGGNASTLALDGGGSTYLGLRDGKGVTTLVHGRGGISGDSIRPTPNIIVSTPVLTQQAAGPQAAGGKPVSIDQAPQGDV